MESLLLSNVSSRPLLLPPLQRTNSKGARRRMLPPRCSMDVSLGAGAGYYSYEDIPKFPRMRVWDPYKCLGVTRDASEEEIRGARNFLLEQYAGHEGSVESVEAAYDRMIMTSFKERKKAKINLKSRLRKKVEESPPWFKTLLTYVEVPPVDVILRRLFLFAFVGAWSIMSSAETGPAFQIPSASARTKFLLFTGCTIVRILYLLP